jgi:hypothetical protein
LVGQIYVERDMTLYLYYYIIIKREKNTVKWGHAAYMGRRQTPPNVP